MTAVILVDRNRPAQSLSGIPSGARQELSAAGVRPQIMSRNVTIGKSMSRVGSRFKAAARLSPWSGRLSTSAKPLSSTLFWLRLRKRESDVNSKALRFSVSAAPCAARARASSAVRAAGSKVRRAGKGVEPRPRSVQTLALLDDASRKHLSHCRRATDALRRPFQGAAGYGAA